MVGGVGALDKSRNQDLDKLPNFEFSGTGHQPADDQDSPSGEDDEGGAEHGGTDGLKAPAPIQKRRRVTRACDECRRKKIKCDGKQPCTHCTVYSYECTYDQPSNRRRNPTPQYIEALETRLQRAEALLKTFMPNVDLSDPNLINSLPPDLGPPKPPPDLNKYGHIQGKGTGTKSQEAQDSLLESMVKDTGTLDLDDEGHWDFHGHSSGMVFLQRLRQQFGDMFGNADSLSNMLAKPKFFGPRTRMTESPVSSGDSPLDFASTTSTDLPPRETAFQLCDLSMSDACSLMRFMHKPTFWNMFNKIYETPSESWGAEENRYLPLLYALLAVGTMFAKGEDSPLQKEGYLSRVDDGYKWFRAARQLMDITDCRDIPSLQAIVCMIMFLQSTAKLSTCWCYVGIALHSAIRMGLHRAIPGKFNPVELEMRRRLFWQIRKMDVYVGAMIGLPTMLAEDDFDQEYPLDVDDEFITPQAIIPAPEGHIHLIAGSNAQTKLLVVLRKVIKYVYPIKGVQYLEGKPRSYVVSHAKIREIERDLQHWMEELPMFLRPGGEASSDLARVQQLLRMAYAYVQMFLYRPFLHYISSKSNQATNVDKRSYACAAACVSVSRNVIHITQEMSKRGLLIGSFWFTMYTTFLAIMALVFFALENPDSKSSEEIMRDARTGKEILAKLAKGSMAADRCTQTLDVFFEKLPERLRRSRSLAAPSTKRKSLAMSPQAPVARNKNSNPSLKPSTPEPGVQRSATFPRHDNPSNLNQQFPNRASTDYDQLYLHDQGFSQQGSDTTAFSSPEPNHRENENINFNRYSFSNTGGLPAPGYGIPDLAAIMFPSNDPFAYPNQPMTTLEKNTGFASTSPQGSSLNTPGANTATSSPQSNLYGSMPRGSLSNGSGLEAQLLDPHQPYLTMDYGQVSGGSGGVFGPEMGLGLEDEMSGLIKHEDGIGFTGNEQQWWGQAGGHGIPTTGSMLGNAAGTGGWAI